MEFFQQLTESSNHKLASDICHRIVDVDEDWHPTWVGPALLAAAIHLKEWDLSDTLLERYESGLDEYHWLTALGQKSHTLGSDDDKAKLEDMRKRIILGGNTLDGAYKRLKAYFAKLSDGPDCLDFKLILVLLLEDEETISTSVGGLLDIIRDAVGICDLFYPERAVLGSRYRSSEGLELQTATSLLKRRCQLLDKFEREDLSRHLTYYSTSWKDLKRAESNEALLAQWVSIAESLNTASTPQERRQTVH